MHEPTEFTLFVSDLGDGRELRDKMKSAGYDPHVVICAESEDTPYLRSAFIKIAGRTNIQRFLATEP